MPQNAREYLETQRVSQLSHQVSSALFTRQESPCASHDQSPSPLHGAQGDWCFPSQIKEAAAPTLCTLAEEGPLTSRIPAWNTAATALWSGQRAGPTRRVLQTLQHNTGGPLAARPPPLLASPAGEGGDDPHGKAGKGTAGRYRTQSGWPSAGLDWWATSNGAAPVGPVRFTIPPRTPSTLWVRDKDKPIFTQPRQGVALPPPIPPTDPGARASQFGASQTESVKVLVRDQRDQILLEISRSDWDGFDHAVHGASPDLIVGLCLRKRLGSSELPRLDLMSADAFVLSRGVWPASWEELSYFAAAGGSFQVRSILRGGMDPGRQVALAAVNFKDSTDWTLLERLYAQVHVVPQ
jgi:hypothetical protein